MIITSRLPDGGADARRPGAFAARISSWFFSASVASKDRWWPPLKGPSTETRRQWCTGGWNPNGTNRLALGAAWLCLLTTSVAWAAEPGLAANKAGDVANKKAAESGVDAVESADGPPDGAPKMGVSGLGEAVSTAVVDPEMGGEAAGTSGPAPVVYVCPPSPAENGGARSGGLDAGMTDHQKVVGRLGVEARHVGRFQRTNTPTLPLGCGAGEGNCVSEDLGVDINMVGIRYWVHDRYGFRRGWPLARAGAKLNPRAPSTRSLASAPRSGPCSF